MINKKMIDEQIDERRSRAAMQWLSNEIERIPNIVFQKDEEDTDILTEKKIQRPPIAELVLFRYQAKVGNVYGYWDKFPIILMVRPFPDHCFGFNLHYLDKDVRNKILNTIARLHMHAYNKEQLFKAVYPFLDALVKIGIYNFAYKNYSYSNITSEFVVIKPEYYKLVADLPIARLKENNNSEQLN